MPLTPREPRRMSNSELLRWGVRVRKNLMPGKRIRVIACAQCDERWAVVRLPDWPNGYWLCPNGCNATDTNHKE